MHIILIYDISITDNGEKALRNIFKTCNKYLSHIQNSVFEGNLTDSKLFALKNELKKSIRKKLDSVIIYKINNEKWIEKEFLTNADDRNSNFF